MEPDSTAHYREPGIQRNALDAREHDIVLPKSRDDSHCKSPQLVDWLCRRDATAGMPLFVLLAVIDAIVDQTGGFFVEAFNLRWVLGPELINPHGRRKDLIAMSAVHRSWTRLSQEALHRRVSLEGEEQTERFIADPSSCPRIKEAILTFFDDSLGDTVERALGQMCNLSFLKFDYCVGKFTDTFTSVFTPISRLTQLEGLFMTFDSALVSPSPLIQLLQILPELQSLLVLHIGGYVMRSDVQELSVLTELRSASPPKSLKSIFLDFQWQDINMECHCLHWLLHPQLEYALDNLYVWSWYIDTLWPVLQASLISLKGLYIGGEGNFEDDPVSLPQCECLGTLRCDMYSNLIPPPSTERLYLWDDSSHDVLARDERLLSILLKDNMPLLRELEVISNIKNVDFADAFPLSATYCDSAGIRARCRKWDNVSPSDDLALQFLKENKGQAWK